MDKFSRLEELMCKAITKITYGCIFQFGFVDIVTKIESIPQIARCGSNVIYTSVICVCNKRTQMLNLASVELSHIATFIDWAQSRI